MSKNIIEVDAKFYKKCKIVMLPTEKATNITLRLKNNELLYSYKVFANNEGINQNQHLYILSDEEIKEGDWMYIKEPHPKGQIRKCWQIYLWSAEYNEDKIDQLMIDDPKDPKRGYGFCKRNEVYKIIATTDPELILPYTLPRPSDAFLKAYCEKGGTNEVLVEYERLLVGWDTVYYEEFGECQAPAYTYILKTAPDNIVTIKPIKDSWNREEVINLIEDFTMTTHHIPLNKHPERKIIINKWIEENL